MANLSLIVGLGNPGQKYARTRHNAGFLVVAVLGSRFRIDWSEEKRFDASMARTVTGDRQLLLCQPQTYMNESGQAVRRVMDYYQLSIAQILIVVDDADLPFGELRLRPAGSSGGHHGLESIEQHLGTRDYARQRIGIGRKAPDNRRITGHVLGRFSDEESGLLEAVLNQAADQVQCWISDGIQKAMSRYNGTIELTEEKQ